MDFLQPLQETAIAKFVGESGSLLGYPTVLFLHTIGLATVAGLSAAVALRALGFAPAIPLGSLDRFFTIMWIGFAITVLSGTALFMADPVTKSGQPVFYVKLLFVAAALVSLQMLKTRAVTAAPAGGLAMPPQARALSVATIVFWVGATTAGRLMAYLY